MPSEEEFEYAWREGGKDGAREEQEAIVRLISEDPRLQGWRLEPAVESYRRLLLDLVHAGEHRAHLKGDDAAEPEEGG